MGLQHLAICAKLENARALILRPGFVWLFYLECEHCKEVTPGPIGFMIEDK